MKLGRYGWFVDICWLLGWLSHRVHLPKHVPFRSTIMLQAVRLRLGEPQRSFDVGFAAYCLQASQDSLDNLKLKLDLDGQFFGYCRQAPKMVMSKPVPHFVDGVWLWVKTETPWSTTENEQNKTARGFDPQPYLTFALHALLCFPPPNL